MNDDDDESEEDDTVDENKYSFDDIDIPPIVKKSSVVDDVNNSRDTDTGAAQSAIVQVSLFW